MMITETILERNLPKQIKFANDSKIGRNIVELVFKQTTENQVEQTSNAVIELKGVMKLIGFMFKPMFKKQAKIYMTAFKKFSES